MVRAPGDMHAAVDARAQRRRWRRAHKPLRSRGCAGRGCCAPRDVLAVPCWGLLEDVRGDCSTGEHANGDDPDGDLRADAAAREQGNRPFAHAALTDRRRVNPGGAAEASLASRVSPAIRDDR
jgi:hypothetical protein